LAPADARKSRPLRAAFSFLAHSILRGVSGVRPIFDPQAVPVTGVDAHLPALPAALMEAQALRRHFASVPLAPPEWPGDGGRFPGLSPRQAAVLVPLVDRPEGVSVLLTRRTEQLRHHAGQISFPGGGMDAADADAWATACREAWEEIGLPGECIEAIGQLPVYGTVTAYQVTPCVGLVQPGFPLQLQASEVAEVFEVPLDYLMQPAHHRRHRVVLPGLSREFLSMPWTDGSGRERFIWGATAAMLRNLYHQLSQGPASL
jgi:8-oxo-dGTP pyrophosphatase MutT (NUDIX family)